MQPKVSILVPSFNGAAYLPEALDSVLRQTYSNWECLIVDDGSTDATRKVTEAYISKDRRIRYMYKDNGGLPSTRNAGVDNSDGEWIQFLDADDWLHEEKIKNQINQLSQIKSDKPVVFYGDYQVVNVDENDETIDCQDVLVGNLNKHQLLSAMINWSFRPNVVLHANTVLIHRSAFDRKRFDESFRTFGDMELFVGMLVEDIDFYYTPHVGMYYRVHHSNITKDVNFTRPYYFKYVMSIHTKGDELLREYATQDGLLGALRRLIFDAMRINKPDHITAIIDIVNSANLNIRVPGASILGINRAVDWLMKIRPYVPKRIWRRMVAARP